MRTQEEITRVFERCVKDNPNLIAEDCPFDFPLCAECNVEEVLRWIMDICPQSMEPCKEVRISCVTHCHLKG